MLRILICCCIAVLVSTGNIRAQAPKTSTPDVKLMYEDIEILRRILARELGGAPLPNPTIVYDKDTSEAVRRGIDWLSRNQGAAQGTYNSGYSQEVATNASEYLGAIGRMDIVGRRGLPTTIEGVYLKGYGVTYTLAVSAAEQVVYNASNKGVGLISICIKCHAAASAERFLAPTNPNRAAPKLSDWEKTRNEIRGEKSETQPSIAPSFMLKEICAPGNLTEKVLKVLADNGFQFQQLPGGENITVVFTFSAKGEAAEFQRKYSNMPQSLRVAQDHAALGDLHLKQQKYAEAIQSYAAAIKQLTEQPLFINTESPYDEAARHLEDATQSLHGYYTKQAQALLALGKAAEAKDTLNKADSAKIKLNGYAKTPVEKVSPNLPAKLIITVSKKALEQHHDGKLTLEQLRKEAEVQAINLPPTEKKQ